MRRTKEKNILKDTFSRQHVFLLKYSPTPDLNPLRTLHLLKDQSLTPRPVTGISWSPDGGTKLAAAYSDPFWKNLFEDKDNDSYIWNIERAVQPEVVLKSTSQLRSVCFNPRDQHILAGGSIYGAVGIWDVRKSQGPVECVPIGVGHAESVESLIWSNSKAGGEFFSTAADGQVRKKNASLSRLSFSTWIFVGFVVGHAQTYGSNWHPHPRSWRKPPDGNIASGILFGIRSFNAEQIPCRHSARYDDKLKSEFRMTLKVKSI